MGASEGASKFCSGPDQELDYAAKHRAYTRLQRLQPERAENYDGVVSSW